jgi:hypothetical protein
VTDASALSQAVLLRIAEFLRDVPPDRLAALARGELSLTLAEPAAPPEQAEPAPSESDTASAEGAETAPRQRVTKMPIAAEQVRDTLAGLTDRAAAARYLDELRLTAPQLRVLARDLGLAVSSSAGKAAVRDTIVQWTVGRRVDSANLSRPRS